MIELIKNEFEKELWNSTHKRKPETKTKKRDPKRTSSAYL
ncbi:uncharacterized protein METZ01_LOCUS387509 [marine metagenome]|uniref:Uncharacterized protein n=1 Tax=marine metagenome TaxID=408172 RepID=A0A382ULD0_9ZZZZ